MPRTLVLNQQYRPYKVLPWQDAVISMFKGTVEVITFYDEILACIDPPTLTSFPGLKVSLRQVIDVGSSHIEIKMPAVVITRRRVAVQKNGVKFSKINVCLRDHFRCQFCGEQMPMSHLNYDHVLPRSRGGKTTWTNIVAACYTCNERKGNRTPEEAGMPLLSIPTKPKVLPMNEPYIGSNYPKEWGPYLVGSSGLVG
jgi:5-methylcytosine-specific restriction endonuclease McrA